jgi:hypothetical protein
MVSRSNISHSENHREKKTPCFHNLYSRPTHPSNYDMTIFPKASKSGTLNPSSPSSQATTPTLSVHATITMRATNAIVAMSNGNSDLSTCSICFARLLSLYSNEDSAGLVSVCRKRGCLSGSSDGGYHAVMRIDVSLGVYQTQIQVSILTLRFYEEWMKCVL